MNTRLAGIVIFCFVLFGFAGYVGTILYLTWPISEFSVAKSGVFGDSFGALNALFSGLAFAGLIITVMLQRDEMHLSRVAFERQQFEASFFNLLNLYSQNLREIRIAREDAGRHYDGVDALAFLLRRLKQAVTLYSQHVQDVDGRIVYEYEIFQNAKSVLVHQARYLSTLQLLLDLVFRYAHERSERERYVSVITSQFTSTEFKYLFYRCLVLPPAHPLPTMVNDSRAFATGFTSNVVTRTDIALYERVHKLKLASANSTYTDPPHPQKQVKKLRRKFEQLGRKHSTPATGLDA